MKHFLTSCLLALSALCCASTANAQDNSNEQRPETLYYNNETYLLRTFPIDQNPDLFNELKRTYRLVSRTGVARGYVGSWSIQAGAYSSDASMLYLNYLECYQGRNGKRVNTGYLKASDIKGYHAYASWVSGDYRAVCERTREEGTFTFSGGRLVNTTFRAGREIFHGQPAGITERELNIYLHNQHPTLRGMLRVTAKYSNFVDLYTPNDVNVEIYETAADCNAPSMQQQLRREIADYLFTHKCMALYAQQVGQSQDARSNVVLTTYDNNYTINLVPGPVVQSPNGNYGTRGNGHYRGGNVSDGHHRGGHVTDGRHRGGHVSDGRQHGNGNVSDGRKGARVSDGKAQNAKNSQSTPKAEGKKHTIKAGETLQEIAQRYKTTPEAIKRLNPTIKNINRVQAGQTIIVK